MDSSLIALAHNDEAGKESVIARQFERSEDNEAIQTKYKLCESK
ncbi:hypothetical protein [Helicobacter sp. T3_23-1059]